MGQKLAKFFELVKDEGGAVAQMRLAMKTGVPLAKVSDIPDSPEAVQKFKDAYKDVTGKDAPVN